METMNFDIANYRPSHIEFFDCKVDEELAGNYQISANLIKDNGEVCRFKVKDRYCYEYLISTNQNLSVEFVNNEEEIEELEYEFNNNVLRLISGIVSSLGKISCTANFGVDVFDIVGLCSDYIPGVGVVADVTQYFIDFRQKQQELSNKINKVKNKIMKEGLGSASIFEISGSGFDINKTTTINVNDADVIKKVRDIEQKGLLNCVELPVSEEKIIEDISVNHKAQDDTLNKKYIDKMQQLLNGGLDLLDIDAAIYYKLYDTLGYFGFDLNDYFNK